MGIWTPQGWRVHWKRWGKAIKASCFLSGDGHTTRFSGALRDVSTGMVEWSDDLHLVNDPFTDGGIYPCDPRVEYPLGQPRWAVSHTLLCYPVADHSLYTHEYVWDLDQGDLQTCFRTPIRLEPAMTDAHSGHTVQVAHRPISTVIEGNIRYSLPNSAVRGVWANREKRGRNYYTRRICSLLPMANGVYVTVPNSPVVQCHGLYATSVDDPLTELFDLDSGECRDLSRVQEQLKIPLDIPQLGMIRYPLREVPSQVYEGTICVPGSLAGVVTEDHLQQLMLRIGKRFEPGRVGYSESNSFDGHVGASGYLPAYDLNRNGEIDADDAELVRSHLGRAVRYNLYLDGYFGGDWLSTSCCLEPEHRPGTRVIADYEFGGGYESESGVIHLLDSPGPNMPVWVEYHYDAPAALGTDNIRVHTYREGLS